MTNKKLHVGTQTSSKLETIENHAEKNLPDDSQGDQPKNLENENVHSEFETNESTNETQIQGGRTNMEQSTDTNIVAEEIKENENSSQKIQIRLAVDPIREINIEERKSKVEWLEGLGLSVLPVAPKSRLGMSTKGNGEPKFKFTGKNPSCLITHVDNKRIKVYSPQTVLHTPYQSRQPSQKEIQEWFDNPYVGVFHLCTKNTRTVDIDTKHFQSVEECKAWYEAWIAEYPILQDAHTEETPSGGVHLLVEFEEVPEFTDFTVKNRYGIEIKIIDGKEAVGELLGEGRGVVCAPTPGYTEINPTRKIIKVKHPEAIGLIPAKRIVQATKQKSEGDSKVRSEHRPQHYQDNYTPEISNEVFASEHDRNVAIAKECLDFIPLEAFDSYSDWIKIGMALHSVDESLLLDWEHWSSTSPKYKQGECSQKWGTFGSKGNVTIGTLIHFARIFGYELPQQREGQYFLNGLRDSIRHCIQDGFEDEADYKDYGRDVAAEIDYEVTYSGVDQSELLQQVESVLQEEFGKNLEGFEWTWVAILDDLAKHSQESVHNEKQTRSATQEGDKKSSSKVSPEDVIREVLVEGGTIFDVVTRIDQDFKLTPDQKRAVSFLIKEIQEQLLLDEEAARQANVGQAVFELVGYPRDTDFSQIFDFDNGKLYGLLKDETDTNCLPLDYYVLNLVALVLILVGDRANIRIGSVVQIAVIFALTVGLPGAGKTPVLNFVFKTLMAINQQEEDEHEAKKELYKGKDYKWKKLMTAEQKAPILEEAARRYGDNPAYWDFSKLQIPANSMEDEIGVGNKFMYGSQKTTLEGILEHYAKKGRFYRKQLEINDQPYDGLPGSFIKTNEASELIDAYDKHNKGGSNSRTTFNSLHDGESSTSTLATKDIPALVNPRISFIGNVQPGIPLKRLCPPESDQNGLTDRMVFAYADLPTDEQIDRKKRYHNGELDRLFERITRYLYDLPYHGEVETTIAAQELYEARTKEWQKLGNSLLRQGVSEATYLIKADTLCARLALALHFLEVAIWSKPLFSQVDRRTMTSAIRLTEHYIGERFYSLGYRQLRINSDKAVVLTEAEQEIIRVCREISPLNHKVLKSKRNMFNKYNASQSRNCFRSIAEKLPDEFEFTGKELICKI